MCATAQVKDYIFHVRWKHKTMEHSMDVGHNNVAMENNNLAMENNNKTMDNNNKTMDNNNKTMANRNRNRSHGHKLWWYDSFIVVSLKWFDGVSFLVRSSSSF